MGNWQLCVRESVCQDWVLLLMEQEQKGGRLVCFLYCVCYELYKAKQVLQESTKGAFAIWSSNTRERKAGGRCKCRKQGETTEDRLAYLRYKKDKR